MALLLLALITSLLINSVERIAYLHFAPGDTVIDRGFADRYGSASFTLQGQPATLQTIIRSGHSVEIFTGATKIFAGTVDRLEPTTNYVGASGTGHIYHRITCVDNSVLLETPITADVNYEATSDLTIITALFGAYLPSFDLTDVDAVGNVTLEFKIGTTLRDVLTQICGQTGAVFHVDPTEPSLAYHEVDAVAAPFFIVEGQVASPPASRAPLYHELKITTDWSRRVNRVIVFGPVQDGARLSVTRNNSTSQSTYGLQPAKVLVDDALDTTAALEARGDEELRRYANPTISGSFKSDDDGLDVGQWLTVTIPGTIVDGEFLIRRVERRWETPTHHRYRVEFGDWRPAIQFARKQRDSIVHTPSTPPAFPPVIPTGDDSFDIDCCGMRIQGSCDTGIRITAKALPAIYWWNDGELLRSIRRATGWAAPETIASSLGSNIPYLSANRERNFVCKALGLLRLRTSNNTLHFYDEVGSSQEIAASGADVFANYGSGNWGPWFYNNRYYVIQSLTDSGITYRTAIYRSPEVNESGDWIPSGAWNVQGTAPNDGTTNGLRDASWFFDRAGGRIIVHGHMDGSDDWSLYDFDLDTGTWSVAYGTLTLTAGTSRNGYHPGVHVLADGSIVILYNRGGAVYFRVRSSGGSWGSEQTLDAGEGDAEYIAAMLDDDGLTLQVVYWNDPVSGTATYHYRPIVGGSAGTMVTLPQSHASSTNPTVHGTMLRWRDKLIISLGDPSAGSWGNVAVMEGNGRFPTSFTAVEIDPATFDTPYGGVLSFVNDPGGGEVAVQLDGEGLTGVQLKDGEGNSAVVADDATKMVDGAGTLSGGSATVSTGLSSVRRFVATLRGGSGLSESLTADDPSGSNVTVRSSNGSSAAEFDWIAIGV